MLKNNLRKTCLHPQGPIQEQRKEIAAVIQRCYKRYKQVRVNNKLPAIMSSHHTE